MENQQTHLHKMNLFSLTWPIFIETLLYMLLGNADTLMLGKYSDDAVAAVGVANQIIMLVIIMFGIIASGTTVLISQYLGAQNRKKAFEVILVSLIVNLAFGIFLSILLFVFASPILKAMNLPDALLKEGIPYLKIVGGFSFVQSVMMTITAVLRSYGYTKDSMAVTIGMNILHVFGNALFIFGLFGVPKLGVVGVSYSTSVSKIIGLVVLFWILQKRIQVKLSYKMLFPFPKDIFKDLLKIGIPTAGEHFSYEGSQLVITYFATMLAASTLTTKVYVQNLSMFIYVFAIAIGQANQILIGYLIGGNEVETAYERCLKSLKIAFGVSAAMALVCVIFAKPFLHLFTTNEEIVAVGSAVMVVTLLLEPGRTFNLVIINALRAAGDVKFPVYMGILSMWGISVVFSYILGIHFHMGLVGMWIAFAMDEWLRGLIMLWRWRSRVWEKMSFVTST